MGLYSGPFSGSGLVWRPFPLPAVLLSSSSHDCYTNHNIGSSPMRKPAVRDFHVLARAPRTPAACAVRSRSGPWASEERRSTGMMDWWVMGVSEPGEDIDGRDVVTSAPRMWRAGQASQPATCSTDCVLAPAWAPLLASPAVLCGCQCHERGDSERARGGRRQHAAVAGAPMDPRLPWQTSPVCFLGYVSAGLDGQHTTACLPACLLTPPDFQFASYSRYW